MPEGDTIERIAQRLQPLVGVVPAIATPHPRTAALRLPERLQGQALQRIEARGKHLLMTFDERARDPRAPAHDRAIPDRTRGR